MGETREAKAPVYSLLLGLAITIAVFSLPSLVEGGQSDAECWFSTTQTPCNANASNGCTWNTQYNYCERRSCFSGDTTNQTFCETTLKDYNLSCTWSSGSSLCDPSGGDFFGNGCNDFTNNSQGCYNTFFCNWNETSTLCTEPTGGFGSQSGSSNNPGCGVITDTKICTGISGCTASGSTACSGNAAGLQCSDLNKSMCPDFTMLSTCCGWNGTNCTTSFDKGCYTNIPALAPGFMFCEDYKVFKNQTNCNNISTTPYYMPCKWDNQTNECHFNSISFGSSSNFNEISTQLGCEAINGVWKTEQFISGGQTKTDSWCEFKFGFESGGGGNCDSACWSCETAVSKAKGNTSAQAQSLCENSALGYCEYRADSNAQNGLGWCNPKTAFLDAGGKSCDSECGACEYLKSPQAQCQNSTAGLANAGCTWVADVNAPNGVGYCYGKSEKYCGTDCFSCYDFNTCTNGKGGNGACTWDQTNNFCKPGGFTGEVCFDSTDNDNDGKTDCLDPDCSTDKFCGGEELSQSGGFGDCPSFSDNTTCINNACNWFQDSFEEHFGGANAGHCDFPGSQCFEFDQNESGCGATVGCGYTNFTSGICGENSSLFEGCFISSTQAACEVIPGCSWSTDAFNSAVGRCEPLIFGQCFANQTRQTGQEFCERNVTLKGVSTKICGWSTTFNPSGSCQPVCYTLPSDGSCLTTNGLCVNQSGICDPDSFGGKCFQADGNKTRCEAQFNATCTFFADANANNGNATEEGWCESKSDGKIFSFMGDIPPTILGDDGEDPTINNTWDIRQIGIRDDFGNFMLGASIEDFNQSAACNSTPLANGALGVGSVNHTFFWYLDSDGNTTNHCSARDDSSVAGFEFSFKYNSKWTTSFVESKASYQCVNGSWGAVPIPLVSNTQKMCSLIKGGMASVSKKELFKFKTLYNKSKNMRVYVSVGQNQVNNSIVNDTAGPFFYSPNSFDFEFEDCSDTGADNDGDGITASNDPDCFSFLKFGFVPMEVGFQCGDGQDNDADGKTDCDDEGCKYDQFICGGSGLVTDANDKTAPKIVWLQVNTFPDSGFIMYDTNEPANGTVDFYSRDNTCATLNKTVRDIGILDSFVQDYKMWHDGPIDIYQYNSEKIDAPLANSTAFFYKMRVCDVSGNCAVSACLNFTTKKTLVDCKTCSTTLNFPFTPPSGAGVTTPMGNMSFTIKTASGLEVTLGANAGAGTQLNHTDAKNFNLIVENPTDLNATNWRITFINASVTGKLSTGVLNYTGGSDLQFNTTSNSSSNIKFVGFGSNKCQEIINAFRPKRIEIGVPGNFTTELWQCGSQLTNCTNKAANASHPANGSIGVGGLFNETLNMTLWVIPAEWGC
ncbi:hypothetical protein HYX14_00160 [Candidatus Woesearchaeota archaeon]|nr:hypothetical protein [Candidatus Woesearchaeota archaeon]